MRSGGGVTGGPIVAHASVVPLPSQSSGGASGVAAVGLSVPASRSGGEASHGGAASSGRHDHFRESFAPDGVSARVAAFLCGSWRNGTKVQYRRYIDRWVDFCVRRKADSFRLSVSLVLDLLYVVFHESPIAYRTLGGIRSAVSAVA